MRETQAREQPKTHWTSLSFSFYFYFLVSPGNYCCSSFSASRSLTSRDQTFHCFRLSFSLKKKNLFSSSSAPHCLFFKPLRVFLISRVCSCRQWVMDEEAYDVIFPHRAFVTMATAPCTVQTGFLFFVFFPPLCELASLNVTLMVIMHTRRQVAFPLLCFQTGEGTRIVPPFTSSARSPFWKMRQWWCFCVFLFFFFFFFCSPPPLLASTHVTQHVIQSSHWSSYLHLISSYSSSSASSPPSGVL